MIRQAFVAALFAVALTTSAFSQQAQEPALSAAECRAIFNSADTNRDGILSADELQAADLGEPGDGQDRVSLSEFMAECQVQ